MKIVFLIQSIMNTKFDNRLKAVGASVEELAQQLPILATIPAAKDTYDEIVAKYAALKEKTKHQARNITGFTKEKDQNLEDLVTITLSVAGAVHSYAAKNKIKDVQYQVDFTFSKLFWGAHSKLSRNAKLTLDLANTYKAEIARYGITDAMIADLQTKLNAFDKSLAVSRDSIVDRTVDTHDIPGDFREIDDLFENCMDKHMELFRVSHPEFFRRYFASRRIVDSGIRHVAKPVTTPVTPIPKV
jgi:hypothetical protein